MKTPRRRPTLPGSRTRLFLGAVALSLAWALPAHGGATAPENRILSSEHYTSDKARSLAERHAGLLRRLNTDIYHCMPWVDVQKQSIGFFKPKQAAGDERYLSLRIYVDQEPSAAFGELALTQRAAAMFSRYVGPLLHRMARPEVVADHAMDGFTVIVEWLKHVPASPSARPVHETIAVFLDKAAVAEYVAGRLGPQDLASRARILGFDGEAALGDLEIAAWHDDFVSTYKVKNYEVADGVSCR